MKRSRSGRVFCLVGSGLLCLLLTLSVGVDCMGEERLSGEWRAIRAASKITIDAQTADWNLEKLPSEAIVTLDPSVSLVNAGNIASAEECSGKIYLQYDEGSLYVLGIITDNNVVGDHIGHDVWRNSCVELWFNLGDQTKPADPGKYAEYGEDDYQINLVPVVGGKVKGYYYVFPGDVKAAYNDNNSIEVASALHEGGYVVEARIPLNKFPGMDKLAAGSSFGFAVSLVHIDPDAGWCHMWTPGFAYGKVTLSEGEVSERIPATATAIAIAIKAPGVMKIDGSLDEWAKAAAIILDTAEQMAPGANDLTQWEGPNDLSAKLYVMYDDKYLYIGANVTDQTVLQEFRDVYIYQGDCIELYLDLDSTDTGEKTYSADDWQIGFTPGTMATAPACVIWKQVGDRKIAGIQLAAIKTATGYSLEAAIPLAGLGFVARPGQEIGFDIAVDDVDNEGANNTENQIIFSGKGNGWQDPTEFARLRFE